MKGSILATAAVLLGGASAHINKRHGHARAHELFEKRDDDMCTTYYTTVYGDITWHPTPGPTSNTTVAVPTTANYTKPASTSVVPTTAPVVLPASNTSVPVPSTTSVPVPASTSVVVVTVPTLVVETCATPGTYTFPATTVVVTETTTVCGATTTSVTSGTNTIGGVTTVVETATTVVCPYATTSTVGTTVTSVIETTTYVCPSAGTYTIAPIVTVVETDTVVVCPVATSFVPGTYTKPAVVTTIVETDVVVYCPFDVPSTSIVSVPATTTAAVPVTTAEVETTTAVPVTTAEVETTTAVPETTAVTVKESTTTSSAPKSTATKSTGTLGGGDQWAITYTPYTSGGSCTSASDILTDLTEIKAKGFTTVRVYSTDCDTLPNVGAACSKLGLKMIIGVYVGEVGCDNASPDVASQISTIKEWGMWDLVELVVVGNEAVQNGFCTPGELASLITEVKTIVTEAGANCPVTTTDTVNIWQEQSFSSAICPIVDVVACNAHAYFNAGTAPDAAGDFVQGQLDIVKAICGLEGYVMETGWPSSCAANGLATCSDSDQATAIQSLKSVVGGSVVFFSYSNDDWKDNGACECEQHWGCGQLF